MLPRIDVDIQSKGVLQDLSSIQDEINNAIYAESQNIGSAFTDNITDYPPETSGNQPPTPYYARGVGYVRSANVIRPASEKFGDNVFYRVTKARDEILIHFRLAPSYSKWLVGSGEQQAWFHALHGWKTIRTVLKGLNIDADETTNTTVPITGNMRQAVANAMSRLSKYK